MNLIFTLFMIYAIYSSLSESVKRGLRTDQKPAHQLEKIGPTKPLSNEEKNILKQIKLNQTKSSKINQTKQESGQIDKFEEFESEYEEYSVEEPELAISTQSVFDQDEESILAQAEERYSGAEIEDGQWMELDEQMQKIYVDRSLQGREIVNSEFQNIASQRRELVKGLIIGEILNQPKGLSES